MKRSQWLYPIEIVLLFTALFLTLPYVPSNEMEHLPLFPAGAFAVILFTGSRLIRWGRHWFVA